MGAAVKLDATLIGSVDHAAQTLAEVAEPGSIGGHLATVMVAERLATHFFACTSSAYPGWQWAVSVARAPRAKTVTVCESALIPGEGALLAPEWLPYARRLAPGDIGPGDVTPYLEDDPLLEAGFEATGDEDVDALALWELGLGRTRVLSPEGREHAAVRLRGVAAPGVVEEPDVRHGLPGLAVPEVRCAPSLGSARANGHPRMGRSSAATTGVARTARSTWSARNRSACGRRLSTNMSSTSPIGPEQRVSLVR